jgi:hypothetical protein
MTTLLQWVYIFFDISRCGALHHTRRIIEFAGIRQVKFSNCVKLHVMKSFLQLVLTVSALFLLPITIEAQAPNLGATSTFAMFTAAGAFSNDGLTVVTGDIGTNVGAFTGFPPGVVIGDIHNADVVSAQAALDVASAYAELAALTCGQVIGTTLGGGQILTPDIYCPGAASMINGNLILDAECDPNAFFIFQIDGALSTTVSSTITLTNGASLCNVYWQVNGAVSLGEGSLFQGTIIAGGAITLLEGSSLLGRGLTTAGAIEMHNNIVNLDMTPAPSLLTADGPTTFCLGDSVILSGNCGGTWSNGATTPSITVTANGDYFATNSNGCGSAESNHFTVTVNPLPACTISGIFTLCEGQTTELCTPAGYTGYLWSTGETSNCIIVSASGTYLVTVTDVNGCSSSCSQAVTIEDLLPPAISCPANVTIECDANTQPAATGSATAIDDCDQSPSIGFTDVTTSGPCAQSYTISRTWTATDVAGNTATCLQTITLEDTTAPVITCPVVISPIECGTIPSFGFAIALDACDPTVAFTFVTDSIPGTCSQSYTLTRTWTATDECGNSSTCSVSIVIQDTTSPVISCPADVTAVCNVSTDPATTGSATAIDICDAAPIITYVDNLEQGFCPMILTRTWTATDDCGNTATCVQTIEVVDNTPPEIICAAVVSPIECGTVPVFGTPSVTDDCDPVVNMTFVTDSISGGCGQEYTLTRTWTATDDCGNAATCSSTITVQDNTSPIITCPSVVSPVDCGSAPSFGTATATDACDGAVDITIADITISGLCPQEFSVTRTWTATDDCGNTATCSATISVQDNTAPVVTCPIVVSPIECGSTPSFGTATAVDACGTVVDLQFADITVQGQCAQEYSVIRTWTATDDCGNIGSCSATITVQDNTPPVVTCPIVTSPIECGSIPSFGVATAIDACDAFVDITFADITVQGICPQEYSVTRTWTATDDCGNTATCSVSILVEDTTAPLISCPLNVTAICNISTDPETTGSATATDICDAEPLITYADNLEQGFCPMILTRTWTATDDCGNTATCVQTIEVVDNTPPEIICAIVISPIDCGALPTFGTPVVTDDCDPVVSLTFITDSIAGNCGQAYTLTRTWTATDDCGNAATCSATIVVQDTTSPVITCPVVVSPVECGPAISFGSATATDACDGLVEITFTDITASGLCPQEFSVTRTWVATDDCGNSASCSATITVQDNTAPVVTCPVVVSTIECGAIPSFGTATAVDACDTEVAVLFADVTVQGLCPQEYSVTRTWTATDDCGNVGSCSATIFIQDNTPPELICPVVVSPIDCGEIPSFGTATAIDACDAIVGITFLDVTIPGLCDQEYTVTRTWTATDDCGNSATCSRTIVVGGSAGLVVTCPPAMIVPCVEQVPTPDITLVQASGNCGILIITHLSDVITNQTCLNSFTLTRTYQAIDDCGNSASCSQIITVSDITAPEITFLSPLPENSGDTLRTQCYGQDPEWDIPVFDANSVDAADICEGEVTITYNKSFVDGGDCSADGYINLYRLTWTATDLCGNSSTAYIFLALVDTIAPVIEGVPDDITVDCSDVPAPPVVYALDECLCACIVFYQEENMDANACQDGLVMIRTWTAIDNCGNQTIDTQRITLIDEEGPILHVIQPQLVGMTDGTVLEYTCNEGGIPAFYWDLDETSVFSAGSCGDTSIIAFDETITIQANCEFFGYIEQRIYQWTAVDPCGNTTILTLTVRLIDNEAPVLSGVPEMVCLDDPALDLIEIIDNCKDVSLRYWDVQIPNPCGEGTAFRRTYEAYDICGNMSTDTVIILPSVETTPVLTFIDTTLENMNPSLVMQLDCEATSGHYTSFGMADVRVEGACSEGTVIQFFETVISDGDCVTTGLVAALELKWTATDVCGNYAERILIVNIVDESSPVFVNFSPVLYVGCNRSIPNMQATDNCGEVIVSFVDEIIPGLCAYEYQIVRLITATDVCGNVTTREQIIHVGDREGPVISGVVEEICDDLTIPVVTAYDECMDAFVEVTMHQDTLDITCRDGLVIQRTWTATDSCGHTTVILQTIIINDLTPPEIYIPSYSVIHLFIEHDQNMVNHSQAVLMDKLDALSGESVQVYDDCDLLIIPVLTVDTLYALDCEEEGYAQRRIYTWVATDVCGNSSSVTFTVDIMDDLPPVFSETLTDTIIICEPLPLVSDMVMVDSMEEVTVVYNETIVPGHEPGQHTVTRTWIAWDSCHNIVVDTQRIIWQPFSTLDCSIILPELVECNSHGVFITSTITGGSGPYTYEWRVVGDKCFLQGGQGTPDILIYIGWEDVKITVTVTDTFGCVTMCMTFLHCLEGGNLPIATEIQQAGSVAMQEPGVNNESSGTPEEASGSFNHLALWPNPADARIYIGFESEIEGWADYIFTNFLGQTVLKDRMEVRKGYNTKQIDATDMPNGSYLMQIRADKALHSRGIIILRNE